jgi:sensor c-di-GMP phosphodiesterase-like protein
MDNPTNDDNHEETVSGAPFSHDKQAQKSNRYGQHTKKIIPNISGPIAAESDSEPNKTIQNPSNATPMDSNKTQDSEDKTNITTSNSVESAKEVINKPINSDQENLELGDSAAVIDTGEWHIPISKEAKKLDKTYRRKSTKSVPTAAIIGLVVATVTVVFLGLFAYFML